MSTKKPEKRSGLCSTGVPGLDDILGGGLPRHRIYLLQGDPGVGKTTIALQFLLEGARQNEAGLYITLSETREELEQVAESHGWDLDAISLFELSALTAHPHESTWLFLAFAAAFCIKAPLFPLHGWLPSAYRESTPEVTALLSGVISKAGAYGLIVFAVPLFPSVAHDWRWVFLGLGLAGLLYGAIVAFRQPDARGVVAYSSLSQMNLIVIGIFAFNTNGVTGAILQMVNHGVVSLAAFLLIGLVELRAGSDRFRVLGGLANGRPVMSTVLLIAALWALAVPGSGIFVSELYILIGAFQQQAVLGGVAACGIVLAAMYMLRWYSALAHEQDGENVSADTPDLRIGELAIAVPLILILFAMTAYPWGVMQRVTTGQVAFDAPAKVQQL